MKTSPAFVLRCVFDRNILMPVMRNSVSSRPIFLSSTGADIWKQAELFLSRDSLLKEVVRQYELTDADDIASVDDFINQLISTGLLTD